MDVKSYTNNNLNVPEFSEYQQSAFPALKETGLKEAQVKDLGTGDGYSESYLYLQAYYRLALEDILDDTLGLGAYDTEFENSSLDFRTPDDNHTAFYQAYSSLGYTHLFVSSNLYVEWLSEEDLALLDEQLTSGSSEVTPAIRAMVERTYPAVLSFDGVPRSKNGGSTAGIYSSGEWYLDGSLIIAFNDPTHYTQAGEWDDASASERDEYLARRIPEIWETLQKKLDVPLVIHVYSGSIDSIYAGPAYTQNPYGLEEYLLYR